MNVRDFVGILRELSFSEVRQEAMIPPRLLVVSSSTADGERFTSRVFGDGASTFVEVVTADNPDIDPLAFDVIVSLGELSPALSLRWIDIFRRAHEEFRLIETRAAAPSNADEIEAVRRSICDVCRDRSVAFGRYIVAMRGAATAEIVSDTSRVNAQFAALSNIPAVIPVIGNVFAAGADFLVLTKNQLMMMYRLAAIHDRDLDDRWNVYAELAPVVGIGFLWRTAARQIAALLPFALGAIPKVAIAYVGTWTVGHAARVYYERGYELSAEELAACCREGLSSLAAVRSRIAGDAPVDRELEYEPASATWSG